MLLPRGQAEEEREQDEEYDGHGPAGDAAEEVSSFEEDRVEPVHDRTYRPGGLRVPAAGRLSTPPHVPAAVDAREIQARLKAVGVRPSRGLGQNFLIDDRVAARQLEHAGVRATDTVLEVGPGLGILTEHLAGAARHVVAVEADRRLAAALEGRWPNVEVIRGDAVRVPWPPFDRMVANLPFSISSPITFRLLEHPFRRASLMFQREFAERLTATAGTKDYSRLTVSAYCRSTCRLAEDVPPSAFWPPPRVHSAVVVLEPRPRPFAVRDEAFFEAMVRALFTHRRKMIGTTLQRAGKALGLRPGSAGEDPFAKRRVGELKPEQLGELADRLCPDRPGAAKS